MKKNPHGVHEPSILAAYAHPLPEIVAERGLDTGRVLSDARVNPGRLARPDARLTAAE